MQRRYAILFGIWVIATILTAVAISVWKPFPTPGAEEARIVDDAFLVLA